jgi:hypothetical protein
MLVAAATASDARAGIESVLSRAAVIPVTNP